MNLVDQTAFATEILGTLSSRAVKYPQDFAPPAQTRPKPVIKTLLNKSKNKAQTGGVTVPATSSSDSNNAQEGKLIKVNVKSLKGGGVYTIQLAETDTIVALKEKIRPLAQLSPANQRLILRGKALIDTKTLADYNITDDTTIHLVQKAGSIGGGISISSPAETTSTISSSSVSLPTAVSSITTTTTTTTSTSNNRLSDSGTGTAKDPKFWRDLRGFLQQHFKETDDADRVLNEFLGVYKDLNGNISSIQDLERLATSS
ncbi:10816_t:CDS:2 [Ambispora gerdemannii]|uniref:10816_t:CDS:1 n=1 Tax=Ambispora gerdemannii TaxID=144530 RepID=A0A9N9CAG2_9GLOM|nr:10816_t:CDS:2 [Ambispora gerdemannii]